MKPFLAVCCLLFSGLAAAQVQHLEDPNVVGDFFTAGPGDLVCFDNDGDVELVETCLSNAEGSIVLDALGDWSTDAGTASSVCGADPVDSLSQASCVDSSGFFSCVADRWLLIRTRVSELYWAVRSGDCQIVQTLEPCRKNDSFDDVEGCKRTSDPPVVEVDGGYIKLERTNGVPPSEHCSATRDVGRMMFDPVARLQFVCTFQGWASLAMTPVSSQTLLVQHPENPSVVARKDTIVTGGLIAFDAVCFNNDGDVSDLNDCDGSSVDEGYVRLRDATGGWQSGELSGMKACGAGAVDPVSSATCPLEQGGSFASCTANQWVLVETTQSGNYWALQASADCNQNRIVGLVPCRSTDSFDAVGGCMAAAGAPQPDPPQLSVRGGYINLDLVDGLPPLQHCATDEHVGRMVVDGLLGTLFVCTGDGWFARPLSVVP